MNTAGVLLRLPLDNEPPSPEGSFSPRFCQKNTGAFIETNCLWAQLTTIDKLIMQMRSRVEDEWRGNAENHTR